LREKSILKISIFCQNGEKNLILTKNNNFGEINPMIFASALNMNLTADY